MEIIRITSSNTLPRLVRRRFMVVDHCLHLVTILCLSSTLVANPIEEVQLNEPSFYGNCQLPSKWHGTWYFTMDKSDVASMKITNTSIDIRGECKNQLHDQYLFMDIIENGEKCWRFMIFFERHPNVIHFKETACMQDAIPLENALDLFMDTSMIAMFRANPQPEPCPIQGPFNFNYSLSESLCWSHLSKANNCASIRRLKFTFESCPEIHSSNKWDDEIECFASWVDHGKSYFAAKLINNEPEAQQFRCFYYDRQSPSTGIIGRSPDASCQSLDSLKIFYSAENKIDGFCKSFPHRLIHDHQDHNRKLRWGLLSDSSIVYDFHRHELIVRSNDDNNDNISVSTCIQENTLEDSTFSEFIVHTVKGCDNYYQCIKIYRRTDQVIEILEGAKLSNFGRSTESICSDKNFIDSKYETLLLESSAEKQCPNRGRYTIDGCNDEFSEMFFGCTLEHQFVVDYKCDEGYSGNYNCHGDWQEGDTHYLVVREQNTGKKRCFVYAGNQEHLSLFDYKLHPCKRGIFSGINAHRVYNASKTNLCSPVVESQISDDNGTTKMFANDSILSVILILSAAILIQFWTR